MNDTGIGIPDHQQKDLFEKFFQADSSYTKKYAGAGLGLAISKELIELMDGKIWFESEVGKGSTFYFTLKMKASDDQFIHKDDQNKPIANTVKTIRKSLKILLAEDDELNRKTMSYFLKREGHLITYANNGKEALAALETEDIDIILMDVQMPEMDGIKATRRIRASTSGKFNPRLPIIALTAYAMKGDRERFLEAGMNDYVSKPIDLDLLMEKMSSLILSSDQNNCAPKGKEKTESKSIKELEDFISITKDDVDFASNMLRAFFKETPIRKKTLNNAFARKDLILIARMAHKITALFSSIQLFSLGKLSTDLEQAARKEDFHRCLQIAVEIDKNLESILEHIKGHQLLKK